MYELKVGVREFLKKVERDDYLVPVASGVGLLLRCAAAAGLEAVVESLLSAGVPVFYCDEHSNTALLLAAVWLART